jgi:hypothetical protein
MSTPKLPASEPSEPVRLKYGMRDTVAIHAGTAQLISDLIDRVFVVDYHMVFVAPDLTPLPVAAAAEPAIEPDRERRSPRLTSRTRKRAARRDAQLVPVDQPPECAAAAQCGDNHHGN